MPKAAPVRDVEIREPEPPRFYCFRPEWSPVPFLVSVLSQGLAVSMVWLLCVPGTEGSSVVPRGAGVVALFTPASHAESNNSRRSSLRASPAPPRAASSGQRTLPDLSRIALEFEDDVRGALPAVLARHGGVLALLDRDDPAIARHVFTPPDWRRQEGIADVSSQLCLWMDPPDAWTVLRGIGRDQRLNLSAYRAAAVFDVGYRKCLQDTIAREAGPTEDIRRVRFAFAEGSECGVAVQFISRAQAP